MSSFVSVEILSIFLYLGNWLKDGYMYIYIYSSVWGAYWEEQEKLSFLGLTSSSHIVLWNLWRSFSGEKTDQPTCLNLLTCIYITVHIKYRNIQKWQYILFIYAEWPEAVSFLLTLFQLWNHLMQWSININKSDCFGGLLKFILISQIFVANVVRFIGLMFLSLLILRFLGIEKTSQYAIFYWRIACKDSLLIYPGQILIMFKAYLFWLLTLINHTCILSHMANFKTFPNYK